MLVDMFLERLNNEETMLQEGGILQRGWFIIRPSDRDGSFQRFLHKAATMGVLPHL
jgi:hypothetical protein